MILYHFTSLSHMRSILEEGVLRLTESNIGSPEPSLEPYGEHYAPDCVWTFSRVNPTIGKPRMLRGLDGSDKRLVRLMLDIPNTDAVKWITWAKEQGINPQWLKALTAENKPYDWWVVFREVLSDEWIIVEERERIDTPWKVVDHQGILQSKASEHHDQHEECRSGTEGMA